MASKRLKIVKITLLSFFCFISFLFIVTTFVLYGRIESMMSIKRIDDGLYTMNYQQNYHLDKALKAGIKQEEDLYKFISKEMFFGYNISANISDYACSAFKTESPDGDILVGRNFDLKGYDAISVYTHPKKGYASVSTVLADMLNVGRNGSHSEKSIMGRLALLASPYLAVDGMNEKGLSAALLDMDEIGETHLISDKPELIVTLAVRLLLDKAATVDEAIDLLTQYDIHSAHGQTQHIFISDASGDYAIVEWFAFKMNVVKYHVCTNFRLSNPLLDGDYSNQCIRFDTLDTALKDKSINTVEESMELLKSVKQNGNGTRTVWSAVFNLNNFTVDYVVDMDYTKIHHLDPKKY